MELEQRTELIVELRLCIDRLCGIAAVGFHIIEHQRVHWRVSHTHTHTHTHTQRVAQTRGAERVHSRELNIVGGVYDHLRPSAPMLRHCHLVQGTVRAINQLPFKRLPLARSRCFSRVEMHTYTQVHTAASAGARLPACPRVTHAQLLQATEREGEGGRERKRVTHLFDQ